MASRFVVKRWAGSQTSRSWPVCCSGAPGVVMRSPRLEQFFHAAASAPVTPLNCSVYSGMPSAKAENLHRSAQRMTAVPSWKTRELARVHSSRSTLSEPRA